MEQHAHHSLLQTALTGVVEAAAGILRIYTTGFSPQYKTDGSPVTLADLASNAVLEQHLGATGLPLLTEESVHAPYEERQHWERFWCVDPLDGTKEFIKRNDEFAINVALIENGRPVLGIIASPVQELILVGGQHVPPAIVPFAAIARLDSWQYIDRKTQCNTPLVIASSRTPHSGASLEYLQALEKTFGAYTLLKKGSALKFFDLATGSADVYPRFAPTMEWDIAAGQAIVEALGGTVTQPATGEALAYNKPDLFNPHFVVNSFAVNEHYRTHG